MLSWLLVITVAYFFFSLAYFGDKLILSGPPHAKLFTFYVSVLSILVVALIPFTKFGFPGWPAMAWIILEATVYILGLYAMFLALEKFEVSRVMTVIGAIQPPMILLLAWILWGTNVLTGMNALAFVILLAGSILISVEKKLNASSRYWLLILLSALMFALDYVFSKMVFLHLSFLQGLIWMRIFSFLFALIFLFDKKLRKEIFSRDVTLNKKTGLLFLYTQTAGGLANILQSFAISLAPVAYLAIINSLRGMQYVFLFLMTLACSLWFPKILKEDISKKILIQKIIAIALIVIGLAILVTY